MYLVAGLGNPGQQYVDTRHNVGFMLLDNLARKNSLSFTESRWKALIAKSVIWDETVVLLKPETFMNASGTAVAAVANYYKVSPENIIVIHDDLDLPFGRFKIVASGGDGGHKGIRSCIQHIGSKDFPRLKIGIGRPTLPIPPDKYVLSRFEPDELEQIGKRLAFAEEGIRIYISEGITTAMNLLNRKE